MAVQSSRFYSDNKGSQKSFYKKYCLWRGSWHYILQLCISAEAVSEMYPHLVRTCFFCIDKCVLQREWWIQTLPQSLWTMELSEPKPNKTRFWVIQAWKVMLHFVFSLLSRTCQKRFIQLHCQKIWSIPSLSSSQKVHLEQLTIPFFMRTTFVARIQWTILIWSHFNFISLIFCIICYD